MCGNFNLDVNDDNLTPNRENEFNVTKFALEWKTNTACKGNPSTAYLGACALSKEYENIAQRICNRFWTEGKQHLFKFFYINQFHKIFFWIEASLIPFWYCIVLDLLSSMSLNHSMQYIALTCNEAS